MIIQQKYLYNTPALQMQITAILIHNRHKKARHENAGFFMIFKPDGP